MKCTFCKEEITDIKVDVGLNINASRFRNDLTWEPIPNMNILSYESLCSNCFDKFTQSLDETMRKYKKEDK